MIDFIKTIENGIANRQIFVTNGDVSLYADSVYINLKTEKIGDTDHIAINAKSGVVSLYHDKKQFLRKALKREKIDYAFKSINLVGNNLYIACGRDGVMSIPLSSVKELSSWTGQFNIKFDFETSIVSSNLNWPVSNYLKNII